MALKLLIFRRFCFVFFGLFLFSLKKKEKTCFPLNKGHFWLIFSVSPGFLTSLVHSPFSLYFSLSLPLSLTSFFLSSFLVFFLSLFFVFLVVLLVFLASFLCFCFMKRTK